MPTIEIQASDFDPEDIIDLGSMQFSNPAKLDLGVYRGDTGTFRVSVFLADGTTPVNVSTATWDCDIRATGDTATVLGSFTVTAVVGQTNQVDVALPKAVSAALPSPTTAVPYLVWDLEMTLGLITQTIMFGTLNVTTDVSRAAS